MLPRPLQSFAIPVNWISRDGTHTSISWMVCLHLGFVLGHMRDIRRVGVGADKGIMHKVGTASRRSSRRGGGLPGALFPTK